MRKNILIVLIVILLCVAVILGLAWTQISGSNEYYQMKLDAEWENIHSSNIAWEKGEIVHIAEHDGGYILYLDPMGVGNRDYLIEFLVYEDTQLYGEMDGMTLENMIKELKPGAFVKVSYFNKETDMLLNGHEIYVAFAVDITEEVNNV